MSRFIGTHSKCAAVGIVDGWTVICGRSYGHDDPETRTTPTDHCDPDGDVTWPSDRKVKK